MKRLLFLAFLLLVNYIFSQSPQYLNYQGVARNSSGTVINSGNIGLKFEILQGSSTGSPVYTEENSSAPSAAGVFTTAIGSGTNTSGVFSSINWSNGPFFIRVSVDPSGGTSFVATGTSQLLSVPYALYAEKAGNVNLNAGNGISITSGTITNTAPDQTISISGAGSTTVSGTYPNFTIQTPTSGASPVITGTGATSVTTAGNNYTVDTPPVTISYTSSTGILAYTPAVGINTIDISPTVSVSGSTLTVGSATALIPGNGLWSRPTNTATILGNIGDYVGIGTSSPTEDLHIESANAPQLSLVSGAGLGGSLNFGTSALHFLGRIDYYVPQARMSFWTNNTPDQMVIDINGRVGIGTNAPGERLQVQSGGSTDISIVAASTNFSTLNFGNTTNHFLGQIQYNDNNGNMTFKSNSIADRLFFEASGRNGMGTNAPVSELDVNGSLRLNGSRLFFGTVGGINSGYTGIYEQTGDLKFAVFNTGSPSNPPFAPAGNSMDAMVIKSNSGNVGINTNFPGARLDVNGNTIISDAFTTSGYVAQIKNNISSGISGGALQVTSNGSRSIGNDALLVENLVTKVGGSGTTKTGLTIQSTGSWAPGTGQPNVGLFVNVSGADINNSAIFMGGGVGIGNPPAPNAALDVNGYTKLGTNAPLIQMVKLTGTTANSAGGSVTISIPAFVNPSKILSVSIMVNYNGSGGDWMQPGYTAAAGFEYNWYTSGNTITVINKSGNSGSILSKPIQVLITYEL